MNAAITSVLLATATSSRGDERGTTRLPSVFELYLVDQIDDLLKPAFQHVYSAVLAALPERASSLADALQDQWQELYAMAHLVAQYHSIKGNDRTISERIYGLQRVHIKASIFSSPDPVGGELEHEHVGHLTALQKDISIAIAAVMPRILDALGKMATSIKRRRRARLERLQDYADAVSSFANADAGSRGGLVRAGQASVQPLVSPPPPPPPPNALLLAQEAFSLGFPLVRAAYDLAVLGQRLFYCFGQSPYSHPLLALAGVAIVRRGDLQLRPATNPTTNPLNPRPAATGGSLDWRMGVLLACLVVTRAVAAAAAEPEDEAGEAILAFGANTGNSGGNGPLVSIAGSIAAARQRAAEMPPPKAPAPIRGGLALPPDDQSCPICRQSPRRYPAVSTGGFVFCYACITAAASRDGICPVSGLPCRTEDIIRIFVGEDLAGNNNNNNNSI